MRQASTVKKTTVKTPATPVASAPVAAKNRVEASVQKSACSKEDFNKKVAEKAYELYVARGCAHGHDAEDWAKAEKIVKGQ